MKGSSETIQTTVDLEKSRRPEETFSHSVSREKVFDLLLKSYNNNNNNNNNKLTPLAGPLEIVYSGQRQKQSQEYFSTNEYIYFLLEERWNVGI